MTKFSPITVFAAASLKKTFTEVGEQFKTDNPSADTNNMVKAEQAELLAGDPVNFASNTKFVDLVTGEHRQKVLSDAGFAKP